MKLSAQAIPWIILAAPFIALAFLYNSIGNEVLVARSVFGNETIFAPKSFFTVFRVPLIEIVCAAAIETIQPKSSKSDYFSVWNILLYAIAFKSLFQFLEFISLSVFHSESHAVFFFYATLAVVIIGISLVVLKGREFFSGESRKDWKLSASGILFLGILLIAYFILAFVPMFIYKPD
jgi:hypothetical protein